MQRSKLETGMAGFSGLPRLSPESTWLVAALRARYHPGRVGALGDPPDLDWDLVMETARKNAVVQLIVPVIRELPPSAVPNAVREKSTREAREIAASNLELTGELMRILDLLESEGISALPYKGPVLAQVAYGNLGMRRFADLDILVNRADVQRSVDVLAADGYRSDARLSPRQVDALLDHGHDWHLDKRGRYLVEVQWAVANHEHMLPRGVQPLMDRASSVRLMGRDVPTLNPTDQVVVLAMHGGIHLFTRLAWVCDMVEAISNVPGADTDAALQIADGAHARRMLLFAVAMADRILDVRPAPDLAARARADDRLGRVLDDIMPAVLAPGGPDHRSPHARVGTRIALADRRTDALRGMWRAIVTPTPADYAAVRLPDAVWPAYQLVRLGRLAHFYLFGRRGVDDIEAFDHV